MRSRVPAVATELSALGDICNDMAGWWRLLGVPTLPTNSENGPTQPQSPGNSSLNILSSGGDPHGAATVVIDK